MLALVKGGFEFRRCSGRMRYVLRVAPSRLEEETRNPIGCEVRVSNVEVQYTQRLRLRSSVELCSSSMAIDNSKPRSTYPLPNTSNEK